VNTFAVESLPGEHPKTTARVVLEALEAAGVRVASIHLLGAIEIGSKPFERYQIAESVDLGPVLSALHQAGRGYITLEGGKFAFRKAGKTGNVSSSTMLTFTARFYQTFRGNAVAYWERQFL
jgi:hypothetical protein